MKKPFVAHNCREGVHSVIIQLVCDGNFVILVGWKHEFFVVVLITCVSTLMTFYFRRVS